MQQNIVTASTLANQDRGSAKDMHTCPYVVRLFATQLQVALCLTGTADWKERQTRKADWKGRQTLGTTAWQVWSVTAFYACQLHSSNNWSMLGTHEIERGDGEGKRKGEGEGIHQQQMDVTILSRWCLCIVLLVNN